MCIDLLTNPTVIGAIIGAIVGAITSATFAIISEKYKFNKQKNGAYALIQSEIDLITTSLYNYKENFLKDEIEFNEEDEDENIPHHLYDFYNDLENFPKIKEKNWINLISFIPNIFDKSEINSIVKFYTDYDVLLENAKLLSKKLTFYKVEFKGEHEFYMPEDAYTINNDRTRFRIQLNDVITEGNNILSKFKK